MGWELPRNLLSPVDPPKTNARLESMLLVCLGAAVAPLASPEIHGISYLRSGPFLCQLTALADATGLWATGIDLVLNRGGARCSKALRP
jgi:hypothetical protein